jgi:CRP/FNR family cyclic AMP-dependent transcriptional regulator
VSEFKVDLVVPCPQDSLQFGERLRDFIRLKSLNASTIKVQKDNYAYSSGDDDDNIYVIESGQIKTVALSPDAKECLLAIYTAGDLFGELCLTARKRVETATAMRDSVLKQIRSDIFLAQLTHEALHEAFIRYVVLRVAEQQKIISNLVTADSEHRLAATLLQLARKLGKQCASNLCIESRISHQELSEMVGTTRSRIGHFLQKFHKLGLIESAPEVFLIVREANLTAYLEADVYAESRSQKVFHCAQY